ncbi:hypothetical protein CYY_005068 [Polysphondylium violaceum]|uniref:Peptidase S28 family protein n=1 Tax=Polysphondylium violaceum TaxID=133409 RepID=A0A8J4PUC4_9MYCE|nr:hypothetical protein CYY_005068 [Polysphondylium violaceum]
MKLLNLNIQFPRGKNRTYILIYLFIYLLFISNVNSSTTSSIQPTSTKTVLNTNTNNSQIKTNITTTNGDTSQNNINSNINRNINSNSNNINNINSNNNSYKPTPLDLLEQSPYYYFPQVTNHFSYESSGNFSQRYCINKKYVKPGSKPKAVFLVLGGEGALNPEVVNRMPFISVANETNSLVMALEIRYYGESMPFENMSTPNMAYLTTDHILEDIANFQVSITKQLQIPEAKWIVMGCSYAGTLSAWYRLKYPHLATAAVASSAPLRAEVKFSEYDIKVRETLGPECTKALKVLFDHIEAMTFKNNTYIKTKFTCQPQLDTKMFLFMLSEALTYSVQYDSKFKIINNMCPKFIKFTNSTSDLLDLFSSYVKNMFLFQNTTCSDYNLYEFASTEWDYSGTRQWTWQICREYGWFMVPADTGSFKSQMINECWWMNEVCKVMFGKAMKPSVERINTVYGSTNFKYISNVLFTNAKSDPWSTLSIDSNSVLPFSTIVSIPGESHCANWYAETPQDSPSLKTARVLTNSFLKQYIIPDCDEEECASKKGICIAKKLTDRVATSVCVTNEKILGNENPHLNIFEEDKNRTRTTNNFPNKNGGDVKNSNSSNNNNPLSRDGNEDLKDNNERTEDDDETCSSSSTSSAIQLPPLILPILISLTTTWFLRSSIY